MLSIPSKTQNNKNIQKVQNVIYLMFFELDLILSNGFNTLCVELLVGDVSNVSNNYCVNLMYFNFDVWR